MLLALTMLVGLVLAVPTNVTIDDEYGDLSTGRMPVYSGDSQDGWEQGASGGHARPDASQTFMGTWHDATFHPEYLAVKEITIDFVGTAVYAYFITANAIDPVPFVTMLTNLSFQVDTCSRGPMGTSRT